MVTLPGRFSHRFGVLACWEKEDEIKTHTPIGSEAWSVGIVFAADLDADRLFPDLQNLADLKNDRHGPLPIAASFQSAVVSVLRVKVVWVFVVYVMNGWTNIAL